MRVQKTLMAVAAVVLPIAAYRAWGWAGVALAVGAMLMWVLLHVTRLMHVLRRAAQHPVGVVDSAVMLHAQLESGQSLLRVLAMAQALGALQTERHARPERFRWTDASRSWVECEFLDGRLQRWQLVRQSVPTEPAPQRAR